MVNTQNTDGEHPYICPKCGPITWDEYEIANYDATFGDGDIVCAKCGHWLDVFLGK
jgi:DNA-directed RNA polymerase subunit RPC12/RpoP